METNFDLVWQHYPYLLTTTKGWCGDYSIAEDIVQETMIKAWRALSSFRGESSLRSWLFRIARNCFFNTFASKRKLVPFGDIPEASCEIDQLKILCDAEIILRVEKIMEDLSEQERSIIILKMEGLGNTEIATELNIKRNRVNIQIFRIREKLKKGVNHES
jgi:RNA polymerase sigma-70 factor (ECF subfamily)